jgi:hypothetical protein
MLAMPKARFRCRPVHDLAYSSTRQDAIDRGTTRIRTLQRWLKAPPDCTNWTIPPKPPGMHWTTYERLAGELNAAITERQALFGAQASKLIGRVDRLVAEREYLRP